MTIKVCACTVCSFRSVHVNYVFLGLWFSWGCRNPSINMPTSGERMTERMTFFCKTSTIHDPLVEGSRGFPKPSTIHDPLVEGSRGFSKTSTIHQGGTLHKGGGATK